MTIVKICGLTNLDDALCAVDAGADMLGFIFYPPSPRSVTIEVAQSIVASLRQSQIQNLKSEITLVGVFVNETPTHMLRVIHDVGLDAIQLSGNEPIEIVRSLDGRAVKVIRKLHEAFTFGGMQANAMLPELILEADHPTLYGGTGQRANEQLALDLARQHRLMLTGGLTPDNVADIVRAVQPWGVDVASGVELTKGMKDHTKVLAFVRNAKARARP